MGDVVRRKGTQVNRYAELPGPLGPMLVTEEDGVLTRLYLRYDRVPSGEGWTEDPSAFRELALQLDGYWAGERTTFDIPLAAAGTNFQERVWAALREIPYGTTVSYGELAASIGKPRAVRAVGRANGSNPVSIIVPCHRVIGASGQLTGYAGGLERKKWLLEHERISPMREFV